MPINVVQYRTSGHRADENERVVEEVFGELARTRPQGLRYTCLRLDDDTFVHILDVAKGADETGLTSLETFARFAETVGERTLDAPQLRHARTVGSHGHDVEPSEDLTSVEELCRLHLAARKLGCRLLVHDASDSLRNLITFAGLGDVLLPSRQSPTELSAPVQGETGEGGSRGR